jgi:hypothetical protein
MQQENYVSTTKIVAAGLWVTTAALLLAAWIVMLAGYEVGKMLALTSGVLAPAAGVAHIKMYSMKVTSLIRVTSGLQAPSGPSESTVMHRIH